MNDLNNFRAQWNAMRAEWDGKPDKFVVLPEGDYSCLRDDERQLLQEIGLPFNGPAFSYDELEEGMPRVDELYGMNNPEDAEYWARIDREQIVNFRIMGQDGGGNPVVFDVRTGEIILLNHENMFVPAELINSSLAQFYQSLMLIGRADAFAPDVDVEALQSEIKAIDSQAASEKGFWYDYASYD